VIRRRLGALAGIVVLLVTSAAPALAGLEEDLADVSGQIDSFSRRLEQAKNEQSEVARSIAATRDRMAALVADLEAARADVDAARQELDGRRADLDRVRSQLQQQYVMLADTRRDLDVGRVAAREWARDTYINAGHGLSEMAFSVSELNDVAVGLEYYDRINTRSATAVSRLEALETQEQRQQALIEQEQERVAADVAALERLEAQLEELAASIAAKTAAVEQELSRQRSLLASLSEDEEFFENELAGLEKEQARIEQLIAERQSTTGTAPGILARPLPGPITSSFGYRAHPILGLKKLHTGADFSAAAGTPIKAAAAGTVILATYYGGYGNAVVIDHGGGMTTLYAHQRSLAVSVRDEVSAGEVIGYVGSTGLSTGPHLHFEVRIDGKPVDPALYL
jgi:murein DD-endopeptidase MepM/ murein hydrolase activator NlpD